MKKLVIILLTFMGFVMNSIGKEKQNYPYVELNNGVKMPQFGLGTYILKEGDESYMLY